MARVNHTTPEFIERIERMLGEGGLDREDIVAELRAMTARHNNLLREMHSLVNSYNQLLDVHGPFHEIELGEPVSRLENILRKALNDSR